jgi:hypothetical protein
VLDHKESDAYVHFVFFVGKSLFHISYKLGSLNEKKKTYEQEISSVKQKAKQTPWLESASELYWPSDCSLSEKLIPTFADRGVSRNQRFGYPTAVISAF